ncbi:MarR family winged helix-turn-helix transcriptional regulator [Pengzhenrongella sicca]|uniref:MarR family transcriptional regulator n=1 Tax=Pengzhenrongella sicca TaxID=2819238 RepID=A0A8A4ZEG2_9MICO|nr:MarR family transcriptional regulator [Pengzhenrongella sicca]QTE29695.1 MarR family transcriptional regulator [Pengzhenrongella sicca]
MTDTGADPVPQVERELGLLMRRARSASAAMSQQLHPDLESSAYLLLTYVGRQPGVRSSDLAAHIGVGRATISRQVHKLEELGLLRRRPDPQDARGQLLELTDEGAHVVTTTQDSRRRWLRSALTSWSTEDVTTLAASLAHLNETIEEAAAAARARCADD